MPKTKVAVPPTGPAGNDRYLVLDFEREFRDPDAELAAPPRKYRWRVYLLPAHAHFEGFGGSRSGLVTGKTPSLVVRETGSGMVCDTEYDLCDKGIWQYLIAEQLTNFSTLHGNGAGTREECGFLL